jgi:hypothetical protein
MGDFVQPGLRHGTPPGSGELVTTLNQPRFTSRSGRVSSAIPRKPGLPEHPARGSRRRLPELEENEDGAAETIDSYEVRPGPARRRRPRRPRRARDRPPPPRPRPLPRGAAQGHRRLQGLLQVAVRGGRTDHERRRPAALPEASEKPPITDLFTTRRKPRSSPRRRTSATAPACCCCSAPVSGRASSSTSASATSTSSNG